MLRRLTTVVVILLVFIGPIVTVGYWYLHRPTVAQEIVVTIAPGTSVHGIARALAQAGAIPSPHLFRFLAKVRGGEKVLKAGEYVFAPGLSILEVYDQLERGDVRLFRISFPEGWTVRQMADYLGRQSFAPPGFAQDFFTACHDRACEGYLFPETYLIQRPKSAADLVALLVAEFHKRFTPEMVERAKGMGMTVHQVVTLASVIEKETGDASERPVISSVFHNRLQKGMRLESDPTVIYGLKDFDGNIRKADLSDPHPYNTYVHAGLPPGPIANPGLAALQAALQPATTDYLFFVSRNNGTHEFAHDYADHVRNVQRYQVQRER